VPDLPLAPDLVARYHRDGYLFPLSALDPAEAADARARIETFERAQGRPIDKEQRHKPHLFMSFLDRLIRSPRVLDPVAAVIGPDILCWETALFIKEAGDPAFISWHQDATYWGLEPFEVVTAWIALSPSTPLSGCMRVVAGSHLGEVVPHVDTFAPDNMLSRGQEVAVAVAEEDAVDIALAPGEMSLHHVKIVHGSEPNRSADRRLGFAIRYIPTHVRQVAGNEDCAMLVLGEDRHGHFRPDPRPDGDFTPAGFAAHRAARETRMRILMRPQR
jgi:hypothetical protein